MKKGFNKVLGRGRGGYRITYVYLKGTLASGEVLLVRDFTFG